MKNILALLLSLICISGHAQSYDSVRIDLLEPQNKALQQQLTKVEQRNHELAVQVEDLKSEVQRLSVDIIESEKRNGENISENYSRVLQMESRADSIRTESHNIVNNRSLLGGGLLLIITFVLIVLFVWLKEVFKEKDSDIKTLRARADDLNRQIVERMGKEVEELQKASESFVTAMKTLPTEAEPDHKVVLAVGDNLAIMETNLSRMDKSARGYTNLQRSIERIKANLMSLGYEIVDMLGKDYVEGTTVDKVAFKEDDSLDEGKQIITAVRKPQINYNGKAIQFANIEVSQNL